ncbi:Endomembrane protein 70 [Phytophthora infestans]|uniref:Transmembrane 9 superfamily member n=1 Tax=Phytophthora infestans TaxID=4787 RepID=A0A833RXH9_PHYIN|nr:Endomembrane protein 70 [Phytophthora infestans]KAF4135183.1 Endomembrane protein 70 [Phytophthora infestans]
MWMKLLLLVAATLCVVAADDDYQMRDEVEVVANTIRPYANPTETYQYYKLPYCKPKERQWDDHDLGELLTGSRKVVTDYRLYFGVDQTYAQLCKLSVTPDVMKSFKDAVDEDYEFEMYVDDIRLRGQVGYLIQEGIREGMKMHYYLNTHLHFDIAYNNVEAEEGKNKIVAVNMTMASSDPDLEYHYALSTDNIAKAPEAIFTYSVKWHNRPDLLYENRNVDKELVEPDDLELHWISVINSFILVMMLTGFLSIVMIRILKRDFSRYTDLETGDEHALEDDSGWKLLHADVFRFPTQLSIFCALNGAGAQLFVMLSVALASSLLGIVKPNKRGGMMTAFIVLYALTAGVGGFHSARLYRQLGGQRWVWNILMCVLVIPGPLVAIFSFLNSVAIWNDSSAALPFGTIMIVLALFITVALPLTIIGGVAGRNSTGDFKSPCRTNKIPREIPSVPGYRSPFILIVAAGCLPFSAVYIELHHIFAAIWGHSIYTLFGILFLSFVMLVFVTAFTTISLTYIQLSSEDHRWWWRSYISGGTTGLFVLAYSVWYYTSIADMTGFFQAAFYFGYTSIMAYCFFVMLGFIGFQSSLFFVNKIYRTIKVE